MYKNIGSLLIERKVNNSNLLLNHKNRHLSHKELEIESNKCANFLLNKGISKGDRIGICMENSIELICIIFAILKIGAIYVPIDRNKKMVQINYILSFTETKILFTDNKYVGEECDRNVESVFICENYKNLISEFDNTISKNIEVFKEDPAYITFTSGTTGEPKGITMSHGSVISFTLDVVKRFNHTSDDRTICRTPVSFDPFLTEILPSVISGGKIFIQNRESSLNNLLRLIQNKKITNFGCGPSLFDLMVKTEEILNKYNLSSLKEIYFGYEKMSINLLKKVQKLLPDVKFINGYGTSETFAATTYYVCGSESRDVFIGDPIDSASIFLWHQKDNRICKNGEMGEIIISGKTLMIGYWKNEDLTKRVIRQNPINPKEKAYFTKDFGMYIDGNIKFIGRKDSQIKINGHRINLEEIREAVYLFNDIKEAIVYMKDGKIICEYNRFSGLKKSDDIKEFLKNSIEDKKIPVSWIYKDKFNRNENTKIVIPT